MIGTTTAQQVFDYTVTVVVFLLALANAVCTRDYTVACQTPAFCFSIEAIFFFLHSQSRLTSLYKQSDNPPFYSC